MRLLCSSGKLPCQRPGAEQDRAFRGSAKPARPTGFVKQGNHGLRPTRREDHQAGKVPNGVRLEKTCCAATAACRLLLRKLSQDLRSLRSLAQIARDFGCGLPASLALSPTPANRLNSGAGEGNRTPDPLITNQMLYRLSYASASGDRCAFAQT